MHVVDPKMIVELDIITSEQANITQSNNKAVTQLINYTATHSEAITRYHTKGIVLHIHSDSSFLSYPKTKSREGGYHYLSTKPADLNKAPLKQPSLNGTAHLKYTTALNIRAITMEVKLVALVVNQSERHSNANGAHRKGTCPDYNHRSDRQRHTRLNYKCQHLTIKFKNHRYAILMGQRQSQTRKNSGILDDWRTQSGRIFHQAPPHHP